MEPNEVASSEGREWRSFLRPAVEGLVALMAAGALYLNSAKSESFEVKWSELDKRQSLTEQSVLNLQANQDALSVKIDKLLENVQEIRLDISVLATQSKLLKR